jgi:hypothetical protein
MEGIAFAVAGAALLVGGPWMARHRVSSGRRIRNFLGVWQPRLSFRSEVKIATALNMTIGVIFIVLAVRVLLGGH